MWSIFINYTRSLYVPLTDSYTRLLNWGLKVASHEDSQSLWDARRGLCQLRVSSEGPVWWPTTKVSINWSKSLDRSLFPFMQTLTRGVFVSDSTRKFTFSKCGPPLRCLETPSSSLPSAPFLLVVVSNIIVDLSVTPVAFELGWPLEFLGHSCS